MDDFEITPAMRAYLRAFDAWLKNPADEVALQRRKHALAALTDAPRVRSCGRGTHLLTGDNLFPGSGGRCKACQRDRKRAYRARAAA